jgi:hypothetical protein
MNVYQRLDISLFYAKIKEYYSNVFPTEKEAKAWANEKGAKNKRSYQYGMG